MLYKEFGSTGKQVSVLGFGGMRFLAEQYTSEAGREECAQLVVKASELGINYFDTAPGYCGGKCEEIFGIALKSIKSPVYISTKSRNTEDPDADAVMRRVELSLKRLGVPKINFFNMWCIMNLEQYHEIMRPGGPYEGAVRAKEEGLIEHICFSTHCDGPEIEKIIRDGYFEGVTLGYNLINAKFREQALFAAREQGIGVATMNSLGGGVLASHREHFKFLEEHTGQTITDVALNYNAAHDAISVVLSGMTNEQELLKNVNAFKEEFLNNAEYVQQINDKVKNSMNDLCTGCNYCSGCPKGLQIDKLMQAYNEYIFSKSNEEKLVHELSHRWGFSEKQLYDCIKCGRCEKKCTQHLPIIQRIEIINKAVEAELNVSTKRLDKAFEERINKKIGIYGIGSLAGEMFEKYDMIYPNETENIFLFDADVSKHGKAPFYKEWKIHSPKEIVDLGIEKVVVCNEFHYDEIYRQLKYLEEYGIEIVKY